VCVFCLEYFIGSSTSDSAPIRRTRSISRSFKNLFRSSSKKKNTTNKTDTSTDFESSKTSILLFEILK